MENPIRSACAFWGRSNFASASLALFLWVAPWIAWILDSSKALVRLGMAAKRQFLKALELRSRHVGDSAALTGTLPIKQPIRSVKEGVMQAIGYLARPPTARKKLEHISSKTALEY
jgi:hypothetical protein